MIGKPSAVRLPEVFLTITAIALLATASGAAERSPAVGEPLGATPAGGCPPIPAGTDAFPSTMKLVLDGIVGEPFVVRASSSSRPDATLVRSTQVGDGIDVELTQLDLAGFHPRIGDVAVRERATLPSSGTIGEVTQDGACGLASGEAVIDLWLEMDVGVPAPETWVAQAPLRLEGSVAGLLPDGAALEVATPSAVTMLDDATGEFRATLLYGQLDAAPLFPEAGFDCFDTLLTADVEIFGTGSVRSLIGFGPTTVERADAAGGGFCNLNDTTPCDDDFDCPLLDTCAGPSVATEMVELDVGGFDAELGSWQIRVLPSGGDSDCCDAHATPGCTDPVCEDLICGMDRFCCLTEWDELCATLADSEPVCAQECVIPDASPSIGQIRSLGVERTYPAGAFFDVLVEITTASQGILHNESAITVDATTPVTNTPPDPGTIFRYSGAPVTLFSADDQPVGEISAVEHTLQPPADWRPPPGPGEECLQASLRAELDLPSCPTETLTFVGGYRALRGEPTDPVGLGQETIDVLLATARFDAVSACSGALVLRVSSAQSSNGTVASLTPEEFFPSVASFDVFLELDAPGGPLSAGPVPIVTTLNALPPDAGETYLGPGTPIDLLDGNAVPSGEVVGVALEIDGPVACTASDRSTIVFAGPTAAEVAVGIPGGGGGVEYDLVRGDLSALVTGAGDFGTATCLATNGTGDFTDGTDPAPGAGFFYVARDGFQGFEGTWNSDGAAQVADRDLLINPCTP